jgi:integrase/recombinase XerC/integrase/recombinase XerD
METTLTTTPNASPLTIQADAKTAVQAFAISQDVKPSSRALYSRTLNTFFEWVETSGRTVSTLTVADLIAYKEELLNNGKSSLTVASYVNSLRRFFEWTEANKIYPNIGKGLHAPKRKQAFRKQPLTVAQVGELLNHERGTQSARDYAILNLMVRTGLRCVEVVRANVGDITYKGGQRVLLVQGKGRDEKDNFVILTDAAYNPIRDYLATRTVTDDNAPLFASISHNNDGGRMTTRAVSGIAKKGLKSVGLDNKVFTAHSLRHTAAVNILRAGGSLEMAQYTLRHANPATTQIYTATLREEQRLNNGGENLLDGLYKAVGI